MSENKDALFSARTIDKEGEDYTSYLPEIVDNIILRPRAWKIGAENLSSTVLSQDWCQANNLPRRVHLNIFGGQVLFNTEKKAQFLLEIKKLIKITPKKIENFYFEETHVNSKIHPCEIIVGYENE